MAVLSGSVVGDCFEWTVSDLGSAFNIENYYFIGLCLYDKLPKFGDTSGPECLQLVYSTANCTDNFASGSLNLWDAGFEEGETVKFGAFALADDGLYYPVENNGVASCCTITIPTQEEEVDYTPKIESVSDVYLQSTTSPSYDVDIEVYFPNGADEVVTQISTSKWSWGNAIESDTDSNLSSGDTLTVYFATEYYWAYHQMGIEDKYPPWATTFYIRIGVYKDAPGVWYWSDSIKISMPPNPALLDSLGFKYISSVENPYLMLSIDKDTVDENNFTSYLIEYYRNSELVRSENVLREYIDYTEGAYKIEALTGYESPGDYILISIVVHAYWINEDMVTLEPLETIGWGGGVDVRRSGSRAYTVPSGRPAYFEWQTEPKKGLIVENMSYENDWNALIDNVDNVVEYKSLTGETLPDNSEAYGAIAGYDFISALYAARMTSADRVLVAVKYNILAYIIEQMAQSSIDKQSKGERVMAEYLTLLSSETYGINSVE